MKHKLKDIDKRKAFEVPEGYFEDLPLKIQSRISTKEKSKYQIRLPNWSLALAASVILIVTSIFLFSDTPTSAEDLLAKIPQEELIAYLDEIELDEYELADAFPEETNSLEFDDVKMLEDLDMSDESLNELLNEFNLENEGTEI